MPRIRSDAGCAAKQGAAADVQAKGRHAIRVQQRGAIEQAIGKCTDEVAVDVAALAAVHVHAQLLGNRAVGERRQAGVTVVDAGLDLPHGRRRKIPAGAGEGAHGFHFGSSLARATTAGRLAAGLGIPEAVANDGRRVLAIGRQRADQAAHTGVAIIDSHAAHGIAVADVRTVLAHQAADIGVAVDCPRGIGIDNVAAAAARRLVQADQATDGLTASDVAAGVAAADGAEVIDASQPADERRGARDITAGVAVCRSPAKHSPHQSTHVRGTRNSAAGIAVADDPSLALADQATRVIEPGNVHGRETVADAAPAPAYHAGRVLCPVDRAANDAQIAQLNRIIAIQAGEQGRLVVDRRRDDDVTEPIECAP